MHVLFHLYMLESANSVDWKVSENGMGVSDLGKNSVSVDLPIHAYGMRLLLSGQELSILPDCSPNNEFVQLLLDDLGELATGSVLLKSWMSVSSGGQVFEVSGNAEEAYELKGFLRSLRQRWLGLPHEDTATKFPACGAALNGKFTALLRAELDPGEEVLAQYFDSSQILSRRRWFRRKPSWTPSHLVAATSAYRLLWITDHYSRYRDRAASVSRSIPLTHLSAIDSVKVAEATTLRFRFGTAGCWSVPIRENSDSSADAFIDAVVHVIGGCLS